MWACGLSARASRFSRKQPSSFVIAARRPFTTRTSTRRRFNSIQAATILCRGGSDQGSSHRYRAIIAVGSNMGDRFRNIQNAVCQLCLSNDGNSLITTSFLHETAPMYLTDQPHFLNGVIVIGTNLEPFDLLRELKRIEADLGRESQAVRNGPRPIDLDILFHHRTDNGENTIVNTEELVIPHPRIEERDFVLQPLKDVSSDFCHPILNKTILELYHELYKDKDISCRPVRVIPLPQSRFLSFNRTLIMGILNVTPDSFSDGGQWSASVDKAVQYALEMERDGADIIDIGGESTRPGALEIEVEREISRTIPVIEGIREKSDIPISIDTRHSVVAKAAINAGADLINDVSGATFDDRMLATMADLGVPVVLMHMRGLPENMQWHTEYNDVLVDVSEELSIQTRNASHHGIHRWLQIVDPGIGFAKDMNGNLKILRYLSVFRRSLGDCPLLLGTSRKGFIGKLTGVERPEERDFGTVASCVAALCLEGHGCFPSIIRVHNVAAMKQAVDVMDSIKLG